MWLGTGKYGQVPVSHSAPFRVDFDAFHRLGTTRVDTTQEGRKLLGMTLRTLILVFTCWAFVGSPALCMAGVIRHACEPGSSAEFERSTCGDSDCLCDQGSSSCAHEQDCSADPCSRVVTSKDAAGRQAKYSLYEIVHSIPPADARMGVVPTSVAFPFLDGRISRNRLPLHPSDLPLLI